MASGVEESSPVWERRLGAAYWSGHDLRITCDVTADIVQFLVDALERWPDLYLQDDAHPGEFMALVASGRCAHLRDQVLRDERRQITKESRGPNTIPSTESTSDDPPHPCRPWAITLELRRDDIDYIVAAVDAHLRETWVFNDRGVDRDLVRRLAEFIRVLEKQVHQC